MEFEGPFLSYVKQTSANTSTCIPTWKKFGLRELFVYEPMTNFPEVFASTPKQIPIFWANILDIFESNYLG